MAAASPVLVTILEECRVSPPSSFQPVNSSLRLTFFDIPWLLLPPSQPLFFYHYSSSSTSFNSTILPKLKKSLSLALLQFFPFAGKLAASQPSLELVYSDGDSVPVTVAEVSCYGKEEFDRLCSNNFHQDGHVFNDLVPTCCKRSLDGDISLCHLLAVQITCFPEAGGFTIGFSYPNAACDQRTFNNFLKSWASLCKLGRDVGLRPNYDRTCIMGRKGLQSTLLAQWRDRGGVSAMEVSVAGENMVRSTFVMSPVDIQNTKDWIIAQCMRKNTPKPILLSPYVVVCAFIWSSLVKAQYGPGHKGPVYFAFIAGGLSRLSYKVQSNYFGNCVAFGRAAVESAEVLIADDGLEAAAAAIANEVKRLDKDVLGGAERWIEDWENVIGSDVHVNVVGSPKVDLYETDFGWGRPKKIEAVGIGGVSLCESRDMNGGIEIGVTLSKPKMEAFTSLFYNGLNKFSLHLCQ